MLLLLAGCFRCPTVPDADLALLPDQLSESGLYADIATETLADGVLAYTPRFPLWSDGADKERWILLPDAIDATDPDSWHFPDGTRAWKTFTRDGARVETRMIEKVGDDWIAAAYAWDGDDATLLPEGEPDAHGTAHDIPAAADCKACHGGRSSFILGFSAVQLERDALDALVADGKLSPAPGPIGAPPEDEAALGYLHANCSHCHNAETGESCYDPGPGMDFTLPAAVLAVNTDAPVLQTAADKLGHGDPDQSEIVRRMSSRKNSAFPTSMPPLATEEVDEEGVATLRAWIERLD